METTEKTYGDYFKIVKNQDGYRIIDLQEQFKGCWVKKIIGDKKFSEKHYETLLEAENMIFKLYQKNIDIKRKFFEEGLEEKNRHILFLYREFEEGKNKKHVAKEKPIKEEFVGEIVNEKLFNKLKHISVSVGVIIFLFVVLAIIQWFK